MSKYETFVHVAIVVVAATADVVAIAAAAAGAGAGADAGAGGGVGTGGAVVVCCFALLAHIAIAAHDMRTSLKNASIIMHTD